MVIKNISSVSCMYFIFPHQVLCSVLAIAVNVMTNLKMRLNLYKREVRETTTRGMKGVAQSEQIESRNITSES